MKRVFHDASNLGGVYRILNTENGRVYYGSTGVFYKRANAHDNDLKMGRHLNKFLQNDYNKCGGDAFLFEVLKTVPEKDVRLAAEQIFLDEHYDDQKQCYNLVKLAIDNRGGTRNKEAPDPLTDGRFRKPTKETLSKRGSSIREAKSSPKSRERAAENCKNGLWKNHSANVTLVNTATQEEVHVSNSLREFSLFRGLNYKAIHMMVSGKSKSSQGWVKRC